MKKIISVVLCMITLLGSISVCSFSASNTQASVKNIEDRKIYFDTADIKWDDTSKIYCHIYDDDGNYFYNWQSNKEKCIDTNNDGVWTYDLSRASITLEEDKNYHVIFSNGLRCQTQPLALSTLNLGQTSYCTGLYKDNDKEFDFPFLDWKNTTASPDYEIGDVDGDSSISVLDATAIQRHLAKIDALSDEQIFRADVYIDDTITVLDATAIQRKIAKLD